nr:unnamed protein product [Callosobruchus chinensis]
MIKVESAHQISDDDLVDLKKDIKSVLTNQKSLERVNDFRNQVNYKIYNGSEIEEILSEYNLPIQTIGPVDASGKDQSGNNVGDSRDLISFTFLRERIRKILKDRDIGYRVTAVKKKEKFADMVNRQKGDDQQSDNHKQTDDLNEDLNTLKERAAQLEDYLRRAVADNENVKRIKQKQISDASSHCIVMQSQNLHVI